VASSRPAFSPFEKDQNRNRFDEKAIVAAPIAIAVAPVAAPVAPIAAPIPVPVALPTPTPVATPSEMVLTEEDAIATALVEIGDRAETAVVASPFIEKPIEMSVERADLVESASRASVQPTSLHSADELQRIAVDALSAAKNQATPADALADAEWTVTEAEIRVQTELSKTMLSMVINAEAEKLVRTAFRDVGVGALKLVFLPSVGNAAAAKKPRAPKSGSVQAKALEHPIVQRAQTLFNAEVRNVIDLRDND
jgi:DNA polymerase III subunit gamma/tau